MKWPALVAGHVIKAIPSLLFRAASAVPAGRSAAGAQSRREDPRIFQPLVQTVQRSHQFAPFSDPVNEFYKKGCQEKSSPSTGGREDFSLEIQPTDCKCPPRLRSRGFALAYLPFPWVSSSGGDYANRVLKLGKRTWYWSVNHGSIGGSWPIAISGYPRRHNV